jgi:NAD(P)-dependent dehydrogenase (short-subunit alcohol dehydrogenase family)
MTETESLQAGGALAGLVAVVTGGVRGIGMGVTDHLVRAGASVVVTSRQGEEGDEIVTRFLAATSGAMVVHRRADATDRLETAELMAFALARFGRLDIAVANAGIERAGPFLELSDEDWSAVMDVNVNGVFITMQEAARVMADLGNGGRIIVISSTNAHAPESQLVAYNASKSALTGLVRSAALELADHAITVNAVAPGLVRTRMTAALVEHPVHGPAYLSHIPIGRFGVAGDVGAAVTYFASPDAGWVTGQTLIVDGGQTLGGIELDSGAIDSPT